ncbi:MAG: (2Fe-2S)-binding protein [Planctomycetes bacterium]|nr:(2Fe-2S)-binding protein [Planctomycetota bacterium]
MRGPFEAAPPIELTFTLNGRPQQLQAPPLRRLLDVLREDLGLTGTKEGCGEGECGACTVLVDGAAVLACLVPACQVQGRSVVTIEGAGFEPEQQAFLDAGGVQCGICTPGMIVATRAWVESCRRDGVTPDERGARDALAGNLCRCTGYGAIVEAALRAAAARGEPT